MNVPQWFLVLCILFGTTIGALAVALIAGAKALGEERER